MPAPVLLSDQERRLYARLRQLLGKPGLLRGSLVEIKRHCGKKSCRCQQQPELRHRALCLGLSLDGKHRTVYVPSDWEEPVRQWVQRHGEVREILEELSLLFLARLQDRER